MRDQRDGECIYRRFVVPAVAQVVLGNQAMMTLMAEAESTKGRVELLCPRALRELSEAHAARREELRSLVEALLAFQPPPASPS
jgi:hypothetical protein